MIMNFRTFGGFRSRFGGTVRQGGLYRGAAPSDALMLDQHDFSMIADLRHPGERNGAWPEKWRKRQIGADVASQGDAPHLALLDGALLNSARVRAYYLEIYRTIPLEPKYRDLFGATIRSLAQMDHDGTAFIFCAAGKDRTGMLFALLGHAMGVSRADILGDYLESRGSGTLSALVPLVMENVRKSCGQDLGKELAIEILGTSTEYLDAMYKTLETGFGGLDGYLRAIGVDTDIVEKLCRRWLI